MFDNTDTPSKILELIKSKSPETVEKLIKIVSEELNLPSEIALQHVIELENQGKIRLSSHIESIPHKLSAYLFSAHATWFWRIMLISISTIFSILTIPENAIPYIYIRYVLGSIFILILPGYSLIKTLFPTREIDNIERTALSIGISLALVPLIGLLLNYSPWGLRLTPITISLLTITMLFAITGLIREYNEIISNINE